MLKRRNNIPGFQEGGTNVDPVSGNEVPMGSLPEEVRDDVDAKLSPGEFVIPADVVRFIGLERLMKMRDEAKKGLQRMSDIGQMGNAEDVGEESNSTYEDSEFESEIDDILGEIEAEDKGNAEDQTEKMMANGGFIKSGTDLTKAPKNPTFDVRYYKNDQGTVMFITHINGKPMTPIPQGFKAVTQEEAQKVGMATEETKKTAAAATAPSAADYTSGAVDGRGTDAGGVKGTGPGGSLQASDLAMPSTVGPNVVRGAAVIGAALGIPGALTGLTKAEQIAGFLSNMSGRAAGNANIEAMAKELGVSSSTTEGRAAASSALDSLSSNLGGPAATSGPSGTGGAAASAGAAAASAAASAGYSQAAIGAAAQAAANAVIGGKSASEAAAAGKAAAEAAAEDTTSGAPSRSLTVDASGGDGGGGGYGGYGGTTGGGDTMGFGGEYAEGGLVNRRQYPAKKKRGKGLAAAK